MHIYMYMYIYIYIQIYMDIYLYMYVYTYIQGRWMAQQPDLELNLCGFDSRHRRLLCPPASGCPKSRKLAGSLPVISVIQADPAAVREKMLNKFFCIFDKYFQF